MRLSRASSITSSACSTPCSAKYWASADSSAWSAATSALTVSRPERGRAVDQHDVVAALDVAQRAPQRQLAAHLAAQRQLGLGELEVGRDDPVVDRLGRLGAPGQHVADRRLGLGVDVEVVGQVALRVEVDGERRRPARRKMSVSVRTAVVLPVPPFWERTAIVSAIAARTIDGRERGGAPAGQPR